MKKIMKVLLLVSLTCFMMGCATYGAKGAVPIMNRMEENKLVKMEKDGIVVTAFPILNEDDAKKYFDENIISDRILAVYLSISNETTEKIAIVSASLKMGQKEKNIPSITTEEAYGILKKGWFGRSTFWWFFGLYIGAPISAYHTYTVNTRVKEDLNEKFLNFNREINPLEGSQGFVWFKITDKVTPEDKGEGLPKGMALDLAIQIGKEKLVRYNLIISKSYPTKLYLNSSPYPINRSGF